MTPEERYLLAVDYEIAEDIHAADIEKDIDAMLASLGAEDNDHEH